MIMVFLIKFALVINYNCTLEVFKAFLKFGRDFAIRLKGTPLTSGTFVIVFIVSDWLLN